MSETEGLRESGAPRGPGALQEPGALSKRFDPRFSPAFQPGYDPRVHREAPPAAPMREEPRRDWPETRTGAPAQGRDWSAPHADTADAPPDDFSIFAVAEDGVQEPSAATFDDVEPAPWWHRINPWLFALWALGIAIILFAFQFANMVFEGAFQLDANSGNVVYFASMLPQMMIFGLPSLICLGLATFVTPFVILAARWHRP